MNLLSGYKTYIAVALILGIVAMEKIVGFDIPGVTVGDDWLAFILGALGLSGLRSAIGKVA